MYLNTALLGMHSCYGLSAKGGLPCRWVTLPPLGSNPLRRFVSSEVTVVIRYMLAAGIVRVVTADPMVFLSRVSLVPRKDCDVMRPVVDLSALYISVPADQCALDTLTIVDHIPRFGFVVHVPKSRLTPSQIVTWAGFAWHLTDATVTQSPVNTANLRRKLFVLHPPSRGGCGFSDRFTELGRPVLSLWEALAPAPLSRGKSAHPVHP